MSSVICAYVSINNKMSHGAMPLWNMTDSWSQCPSVIWTRWNWWSVNRWVRSMLRRCHRLSTEASFVFFLLVWFPLQMKLSLLATEKFERFDTRRWTGWRQSPFGRHSLTNRSATMNFSGGGGGYILKCTTLATVGTSFSTINGLIFFELLTNIFIT